MPPFKVEEHAQVNTDGESFLFVRVFFVVVVAKLSYFLPCCI